MLMKYRPVFRRVSKHKTFLMILVGVLLAYAIFSHPDSINLIESLGEYRLVGATVAGFLFSSALTTAPSLVAIYFLAQNYSPFLIALFGAFGAMLADVFLYKYVVSGFVNEIEHDFKFVARLEKYRNRGIYKYLVPIVGGFIICSPLPDELGIALLGSKSLSLPKFLAISYVFNFLGIFLVALIA